MSKLFLRLVLVAGIGVTAAACQDQNYGAQRGYNQPAANPYYNNSAPAPQQYGYSQPAPYYNNNNNNQQGNRGAYSPADGRRYTTVLVTNRGQNGYRDDVVQQQVVCGSQYSDGYRTRTAPQC
ncbi:hypothetical protein BH11PSE3_BH11PSE3_46010 [soil metagenome]